MTNAYNTGETDDRPWGRWEVLAVGDGFAIKKIDVLSGKILSLQSHDHRSEHWTILTGSARVTLNDAQIDLAKDESIFITVGSKHRVANIGTDTMSFIEIQTGKTLDEADIVRFQDEYGRA